MDNTKEKLEEIDFAFSNLRYSQKVFAGMVMDLSSTQFYLTDEEALQSISVVKEILKLAANDREELLKVVREIIKERGDSNGSY